MQLYVRHETVYRYEHTQNYSIQSLRLTPRRDSGQRTLSWRIVSPGRQFEHVDAHGNVTHLLTLTEPHAEIAIVVSGVVDTGERGTSSLTEEGLLSPLAYLAPTALTRSDDAMRGFALQSLGGAAPLHDRLLALSEAVSTRIRYQPGVTDVQDDAVQVLARGEGVCQDQAHVFIACCRAVGVPARYVSGYFHAGDAGEVASHAWADVWLGREAGWLSLDVTHCSPAGASHCRLAVGRDYLDAAPIRGVRHGDGREEMKVSVLLAASALQHQQQIQQ